MPDAKTLATRYVELRGGPPGPLVDDVRTAAGKAGSEGGRRLTDEMGKAGKRAGDVSGLRLNESFRSHLGGLTSIVRGQFAAIAAAAGGAFAIGKVFTTGAHEVSSYQQGLAQLTVGLKSTGNVAGITVPQMEKLAGSIQAYSGQTDDSITKTESLLLTFTNIKNAAGKNNDVFTQTTKIAADMAARLGGDASGAAIQLGKALNDPVKGITALTRVGVSFSQQQQTQIGAMVKSGNTLGAQKVILKELNKEFGGSAKAAGETLPGQLARLKRSFEDVSQQLVTDLIPVMTKVLPVVLKALEASGPLVEKAFKGIQTAIKFVTPYVLAIGAAFTTKVLPVLKAVGAYLGGAFHSAFTSIGKAINDNRPFLTTLVGDLKTLAEFIATKVAPVLVGLLGAEIKEAGRIIASFINVVAHLYTALRDLVLFVSDVFHLRFGKAFNDLKGVVSNALGAIVAYLKGWPADAVKALGALGGLLVDKGKDLIKGLLTGIGNKVFDLIDYIESIPDRIVGWIGDLGTLLYDAGKHVIQGLINGIKASGGSLINTVKGVAEDWVAGPFKHVLGMKSPSKVFHGYGLNIMQGLANGITAGSSGASKAIVTAGQNMVKSLKSTLGGLTSAQSSLSSGVSQGLQGFSNLSGLTTGSDGVSAPTFTDLTSFLSGNLNTLLAEKTGLGKLTKAGLSKGLTQQLAGLDPSQALGFITALNGAGKAGISQVNALQGGIVRTSNAIGAGVGNQAYGAQITDQTQTLHRIEVLLAKQPAAQAKATAGALTGTARTAKQKGTVSTKPKSRGSLR